VDCACAPPVDCACQPPMSSAGTIEGHGSELEPALQARFGDIGMILDQISKTTGA
jgi:hypothetical protein